MHEMTWDFESRSAVSLKNSGSWRYAADATTEILCLCYAIDDGEVQTWLPPWVTKQLGLSAQLVPQVFFNIVADPSEWKTIAHLAEFERSLYERILVPKHGFPALPLEVQHCSMTLALANGYPAELDLLSQALELKYRKDMDGVRLMRTMSRPRKPRKGEDKNVLHWLFDVEKLQRLILYCQRDVDAARAVWRHPKLKPLIAAERRIQILDAEINRRGVRADRELATAARDMAVRERARLNAAMAALTEGVIDSIDQVQRIRTLANANGHDLRSLGKRSVAAVLAGEPSELVRQLLELRRDGARASTKKYQRILDSVTDDDRIRGTMRMYGAGPGRWSGRGPQLQNLKKNEDNIPLTAIEAVRSGDRDRLRAFGNPLTVLGNIARAVVCTGPGNVLMAADFGAIESRVLAWLAGETWKLEAYREYDRSGDRTIEPYRIIAAQMLHKWAQDISKAERNTGKAGELACGFGGSVGAWRRIASDDQRSDEEIRADVYAWRQAHPKTTAYWRELARAIRIAIRTGQPAAAGRIVAGFADGNLTLILPSGRQITYPQARLVPSNKFEDGDPDVLFKDNAHGKWTDYRGWFGTFVENVVQGTARDLLAAAIERFEARGIEVVLTVHDEVVAEVPAGSISEADFLSILLEAPAWAVVCRSPARSGTVPTIWSRRKSQHHRSLPARYSPRSSLKPSSTPPLTPFLRSTSKPPPRSSRMTQTTCLHCSTWSQVR
jgi:DNA polymerase bacteriophage-type